MVNNEIRKQLRMDTHRFDDPFLFATIIPHAFEQFEISRQDVRLREESKFTFSELQLEFVEIPPQAIFAPHLERTREMVDLNRKMYNG